MQFIFFLENNDREKLKIYVALVAKFRGVKRTISILFPLKKNVYVPLLLHVVGDI